MPNQLLFLLLLAGIAFGGKVLGAPKKVEKYDEVHHELANKAVAKINAESNDYYKWSLVSLGKHCLFHFNCPSQMKSSST